MNYSREDIVTLENIFSRFYEIGMTDMGGVTRLGYTETEDLMHSTFIEIAEELGLTSYIDEAGNTFVANDESKKDYYLMGSHLDSVVNGGRYDGVAGIVAGLLVFKWARDNGLNIPLRMAAWRCEESSNFGRSTLGSSLITKQISAGDVMGLKSKDGKYLADIFKERNYSMDPPKIHNVKQYLELHIEQGKVLEEYGIRVGIVTDIAAPRRFRIHLHGQPEHSGATPMNMRFDALCAAAELILEIERIGKDESYRNSVATVGVINNEPNVMNVVPGSVTIGVDLRGTVRESLDIMEKRMREAVNYLSTKRSIPCFIEETSRENPVKLDEDIQKKLRDCAEWLRISHKVMPSGAGHDAMCFAHITKAGMIFIPCAKGISHNKNEFTSLESILDGARVMYEYYRREGESYDPDSERKSY